MKSKYDLARQFVSDPDYKNHLFYVLYYYIRENGVKIESFEKLHARDAMGFIDKLEILNWPLEEVININLL